MKKHGRGLGKLQILQRQRTEQRILDHLDAIEKVVISRVEEEIWETQWAWVRSIHQETRIEMKSLIKALDRMVEEGKILEKRGKNNRRLFCLPGSVNANIIRNQNRSNRKAEKPNKYWLRQERIRKRNVFMYNPRDTIKEAIIKIEEEGEDETKVLDEIGISKRGYESWIKRSPRLAFIRKKIIENEKIGIVVPDKWKAQSPLWLKRYLICGENIT